MYKTAYNSGSSPVVIDDEGRSLGGGEWGTIDTTSDQAKQGLDRGALVIVEEPGADAQISEAAGAAFARTNEVAGRAEKLARYDRDELAVIAGLGEDDEVPLKADLVRQLAARDVEIPSKTALKQQAATESQEA